MTIEERAEHYFPVGETENGDIVPREPGSDLKPSFREKQKQSIMAVMKGIENDDVDVVKLNAPTGAGKSLILYTAVVATGGSGFITTPLNTLVDQMDTDEFMSDKVITLKGRNNYNCIHPEDKGTPVDEAICQRQSTFECDVKDKCPYYGRKARALDHPTVVTNMSYLMAEGMIPDEVAETLGDRSKLVVDECQNIEDFAMSFIQFTVSQRTVPRPVWKNISIPPERREDDMEYLIEWLEDEVLTAVRNYAQELQTLTIMDTDESKELESLKQFEMRVQNFLRDVKNNEWIAEMDVDFKKNAKNQRKIVFNPVFIGRFLEDLLWSRGETVILSSATIPGEGWLDEIGLGDKEVMDIKVGSMFPVDNRPVICNLDVGKMVSEYSDNKDNRKENAYPMAKRIMELAIHHEGEKGFVHCRSYNIAKMLRDALLNHQSVEIGGKEYDTRKWVNENVMMQDRYNREESLEEWINNDKQVFMSVAMDEGVDLKYDKCRWQVLAKTLYPFMDKRMKRRKEIADNKNKSGEFWNYYNRKAVIQLQQAYGRGVRARDDECVFYILDSSAAGNRGLIQMNAELFNEWFLEAVQGINIDPSRGM